MNRGVEIASEVADGPYSVILEQVTNGVAVRMAVLYLLGGAHLEEKEMLNVECSVLKLNGEANWPSGAPFHSTFSILHSTCCQP